MPGYDETYQNIPDMFGSGPTPLLEQEWTRLEPGLRVLDVGSGQGRNTLFLARRGLSVDAVEPSRAGLETMNRLAGEAAGRIRSYSVAFEEFVPEVQSYGAVLVFGLIQDLARAAVARLAARLGEWTTHGGLAYVTAFGVGDPSYELWRRAGRELEKHSFAGDGGRLATFLEPGELERIFAGWEPVLHRQGLGPPHRHGHGPIEQHDLIEAIFRKPR